jgi:hypothetical protein
MHPHCESLSTSHLPKLLFPCNIFICWLKQTSRLLKPSRFLIWTRKRLSQVCPQQRLKWKRHLKVPRHTQSLRSRLKRTKLWRLLSVPAPHKSELIDGRMNEYATEMNRGSSALGSIQSHACHVSLLQLGQNGGGM